MSEKNPLTEMLRPHVKELQKDVQKGNELAKQVISTYQLYVSYHEHAAAALCKCFFDDWQKRKGARKRLPRFLKDKALAL